MLERKNASHIILGISVLHSQAGVDLHTKELVLELFNFCFFFSQCWSLYGFNHPLRPEENQLGMNIERVTSGFELFSAGCNRFGSNYRFVHII